MDRAAGGQEVPVPASGRDVPVARNAALEGLRAVAAMSVFAYHLWRYTPERPSTGDRTDLVPFVLSELRVGLVLFFVLTGFLLYRAWVRAALGEGKPPALGRYLRHRLARIAPAYWVALLGSYLLMRDALGTHGVVLPPHDHLWLFPLFGQNFSTLSLLTINPPMWTTAVEMQFYLALPLLGMWALRSRADRLTQTVVPILVIMAGCAWNLLKAGHHKPLTWADNLPALLPYFGVGMLAATLTAGMVLSRRTRALVFAAGIAMVLFEFWMDLDFNRHHDALLKPYAPNPIAACGFAAIIAAAASTTAGPLTWRPVVAIGRISYGIYLWHVPLILWLRSRGMLPHHLAGSTLVAVPIACLVAQASWVFVEKPAIEWGRSSGLLGHFRGWRRRPVNVPLR
jgi:peptidoglycan/LPS O-acetylase OafA/YrhL